MLTMTLTKIISDNYNIPDGRVMGQTFMLHCDDSKLEKEFLQRVIVVYLLTYVRTYLLAAVNPSVCLSV